MKFESADLIYQPRGIQKCNKMGGITDSTKRYGFWKKSSDEPVREPRNLPTYMIH